MNPNVLKVWVVSQDEFLLRDATWGLSNFECRVTPFSDFSSFESLWGFVQPDLVLVDVDHADLASIARLLGSGGRDFTYTILVVDSKRPTDHISDLEGTFHDAISKPLNGGEMLTRIRASVRFMEFERRMRDLSLVDQATNLLSRHGLMQKMAREVEFLDSEEPQEFVMVGTRLDYLDTLMECRDSHALNRLIAEIYGLFAEIAGEEEWMARLRPDEYAIVIPDSSDEEGEAIAILMRDRLANHEFIFHGLPLRLSATYCINVWNPLEKAFPEVLAEAERTLNCARSEGGDAIVRSGQFDSIMAVWEDDNWAGVDLTNLTARDVMQPFTSEWRESESNGMNRAAILNSGIQLVPYIDQENRYHGILSRDILEDLDPEYGHLEAQESSASAAQPQLSDLVKVPSTVPEDLPYAELMGYFTEDQEQTLVVIRGSRPLGYITQKAMSSLLDPIDKCGYRTEHAPSFQSDYLIVPELPVTQDSSPIMVK
jgi:GGDEF domain-containing protein